MTLPPAILRAPELDRWLRIDPERTVTVNTGKVEIGQGIKTAIAIIAAEELDLSIDRIRVQTADTELTPNELVTAGSQSVEDSGSAVRVAAAAARAVLIAKAASLLGVDAASIGVEDGVITSAATNERTDYWTLAGGRSFDIRIETLPPLKSPQSYRKVGRGATRIDLLAKVRGCPAFVHDLRLPGLLHGRIVKPPRWDARLVECPDHLDLADARLVRDGALVGVVAASERVAREATRRLAERCRWKWTTSLPTPEQMPVYLRERVTRSLPVVDGTPVDAPVEALPVDARRRAMRASYYRPFQMHATLGPSCAVAQFEDGRLTVYCHSQGVELLKRALADVLELAPERVRVIHVEGAGAYGHNGADDVALDASLLALAATPRPVRVQWSRADEHACEPYGPAALVDMRAEIDDDGRIQAWSHETYSFSHMGRPRPVPGFSNLQSAWSRARAIPPAPRVPAMMKEVGIHRNMEPIYRFPVRRLVKHFLADSPLRTSSLRSLGAFANVFAIESFMDECAHAIGADPLEFRMCHLEDPRVADARAIAVLELLRERAPPKLPGTGRGYAIARYKNRQTCCALLVDASVADDGTVRLVRTVLAADAGLVIDPDGLRNQLEGGFIQAASWTLGEEVLWDDGGVVTRDWERYPILRFSEIPQIETHLLDRSADPALGAGEASTGPTPAAIANAIFDAVGVRVRRLPITPARVREAAGEG